MSSHSSHIPASILIVGSGVFGLGTAYALATRAEYKNTSITILDRHDFPAPDGSSVDSSRIIRADYADLPYAELMAEAMPHWEGEFGADGRFTQCGLCLIDGRRPSVNGVGSGDAPSFVDQAFFNVTGKLGLKPGRREDGGDVTLFSDEAGAREIYADATGGVVGTKGYVNWTSGWAHAEDGMKFLRRKVESLNRVHFRTAEVARLLFDGATVCGVQFTTDETLHADLTILASGAWTPRLIDLRGVASATGQVVAYIDISREEEARLSGPHHPTILRGDDGLFIIPPRDGVLKIARHGYGYANPTTIPHPEKPPSSGETITVSLPRTRQDDPTMHLPPEGVTTCRDFLRQAIPALGDRPFSHERVCWYTDTPSGDWLITYHPMYTGLFLATGGSGHGYKFLPVIGERIVDILLQRDRDTLGSTLRKRWAWPGRIRDDHVWCDDWRGNAAPKGMLLDDEYKKSVSQRA